MPYNITGPLLTKIAEVRDRFDLSVLMMQREVGQRVLAGVGSPEYGSLSVFLQSQFKIETVCDAPAGAFWPPPKVQSIVLQFRPQSTGFEPDAESQFFRLVRKGFTQPRKTLENNLVADFGLSRDQAARLLAKISLDTKIRPHQLDLKTWKALSLAIDADQKS
jgi:16S rRNA (adenine1518-N6/adenine1519-N6)-dimethyltransferase